MKTTLSIFSDCFFYAFITLILTFTLLSFYFNNAYSITISIIFALLIFLIVHKKIKEKRRVIKLKSSDKRAVEDFVFDLSIMPTEKQKDFIIKLLNGYGKVGIKHRGGILVKDSNAILFLYYDFIGVEKHSIIKAFNVGKKDQTCYLLAPTFANDIIEFSKLFNKRIVLIDKEKLFLAVKEKNLCLKKSIPHPKADTPLLTLKDFLDGTKAKKFLFFGLVFLSISYFVVIKTYYLVFGFIFLLFALFLKVFGKKSS